MEFNKSKIKYTVIAILIILLFVATIALATSSSNKPEVSEEPEQIVIVPYTDYDWSKLSKDNNHYKYEDENYTSMFGIDVAAHQETIDWKKVKEAGVEFAYIRLGYRGAVEGILHTDLEFEKNYKGATENGIKVGVYWYAQPANIQEIVEEAKYVISVLNNRQLDLPIVFDFEETEFSDGSISRMHGMSGSERTKMAVTFCNEILKNHYDVMIYTNLYWAETFYNWKELEDYPVWYAQYATYPNFNRPLVIWQYDDNGHIDGIDRSVDLDLLFIRKSNQN